MASVLQPGYHSRKPFDCDENDDEHDDKLYHLGRDNSLITANILLKLPPQLSLPFIGSRHTFLASGQRLDSPDCAGLRTGPVE